MSTTPAKAGLPDAYPSPTMGESKQGYPPPNIGEGQGGGAVHVLPYTTLCLAALAATMLVLVQKAWGTLSLVPVLVGLLGIATRWSSGPVMLVLTLAACMSYSVFWQVSNRNRVIRLDDLVLCGAVLAYVAGHYRLQSIAVQALPPDLRRRQGRRRSGWFGLSRQASLVQQKRSPRLVSQRETAALILSLPVWAGLAQLGWKLLPAASWSTELLGHQLWRAMVLAWIIGLCLFVAAAGISLWNRYSMTAEEAAMFLQDVLWHETRREQRRLNRWLAWARLRHRRGR